MKMLDKTRLEFIQGDFTCFMVRIEEVNSKSHESKRRHLQLNQNIFNNANA
jgi:hypothetical protein